MPSKAQRRALNASVERRFPKGSTKGDTLAYTINLGSSFRQIDSLSFSSVSKSKGFKPFSSK